MKTIKYILSLSLLIAGTVLVQAQYNSQKPEYEFQSTSAMVGSGSSLPQAALEGTHTTYDIGAEKQANHMGPRKVSPGSNTGDPGATPIGEGIWVLMLLVCGYAGTKLLITKKQNQ